MRTIGAITLAVMTFGLTPALAAEIVLEDCNLGGSLGISSIEARCGWLERPENEADPDSPNLRLRVIVAPALSPSPRADAFTVINGGPGASSIDLYADTAGVFAPILRDRDIVVLDQRGTGDSNPLDCPELDAMNADFSAERVREATTACLDELPADPSFYTTSVAVRDLEAMRDALGYAQLNVYGVSYGTRVAQHYARRYPEAVRTLIIDGVVPPEVSLGPNAALNAQRTLDRLLARCAEDPACSSAFPAVDERLNDLRARLTADPVSLTLANPVSGRPENVNVSYAHLMLTLRLMSYAPETASLLPLIIDEAQARDNFVPLAANALRIQSELTGAISLGMHNSVVCAEDIPFLGELDFTALEATYIGPDQVRALEVICEQWPRGPVDDDLRQPLTVPVPTLILSGQEDPITPPEYGALADRHLPDSLHLIAPGQGHGVVARGCIPRLVQEFVDSGDPAELDATCVERLTHQPFFLNLMGPSP